MAFATRYFPNAIGTPSGSTTAYCTGQANVAYSATVTMCGTTTGGGAATNTITAEWYWNGTLVYTDPVSYTPSSIADIMLTIPAGTFTLTPAGTYSLTGSVAGSGLFVRLTWTDPAPVGCTMTTTGPMDGSVLTINVTDPAPNTGTASMCISGSTTLFNANPGGTWSSSATSIATVSGTGVVAGIAAGTSVISYAVGGCLATTTVTVNGFPAAITGPSSVCVGNTITLVDATPGGMWSSSAASIASAGTAGDILGVSAGTATISYTATTGCITTTIITVNAYPAAITGSDVICIGGTTSLTNAIAGGTWSSSVTGVATISSSGVVSGVGAGTSVISYVIASCGVAMTVTVNAPPAAITGSTGVCEGSTITLSNTTPGGAWSSSNTSVATISASGEVSGIAPGATLISYTVSGCSSSVAIMVNPNPAPILPAGSVTVCEGASVTLSDATSGGTWSSGATATATVSAGGVVTGVTAGTVVISYVLTTTGCITVKNIGVNPSPTPITGSPFVCLTGASTLTEATSGGTWSSSNAAVVAVSPVGVIGGMAIGTAIISYTISTGCFDTVIVRVNNAPGPIIGGANVCVSSTMALSDTVAGGTWSSSAPAVATVGTSSGIVSGVSGGAATISYTIPGCASATHNILVFPQPAPPTGTMNICVGFPASLFDATPGGLWSSDDVTKATVGATTGVVTGVAMGTTTISYALPGGCGIGTVVTVNAMAPITGDNIVCVGATTFLADIVGGGTWTISNTAIATTSSSTANVTGVAPGTTHLVYTLPTGCTDSTLITVLPPPPAIGGSLQVCRGVTVTLTNATSGGTWSSANTLVAEIGSSGAITGIYPDTVRVTYTLPHHCHASAVVTVNPVPIASVTFNAATRSLSAPTTFASYQWYSSVTGLLVGVTSSTLAVPGVTAYYYVVVSNSYGCTDSAGYYFELPAGVLGNSAGGVRVYPNPATATIHIDAPVAIRTIISGMDGRAVLEQAGTAIDVSALPQGIYLLNVYDQQGTRITTERFTKQ